MLGSARVFPFELAKASCFAYINSLRPPFLSLPWPSLYSIGPIMSVSGADPVHDKLEPIALPISDRDNATLAHEQPADVSIPSDKPFSGSALGNSLALPKEDASNGDVSGNAEPSALNVCCLCSYHPMSFILSCHPVRRRSTGRCEWPSSHSRRCARGHHSTQQGNRRSRTCIGRYHRLSRNVTRSGRYSIRVCRC